MIEILLLDFTPLMLISCAVAMIVLRAGASMVFFDIVGTFQAGRLIKDSAAAMTAFEGLMLDGLSNVEDAVMEVFRPLNELRNATMPIAEDVELARIEFEKFVRESNQAALGQEITEIGNAFGYTAEQSYQAGARMAQLASVMGEAALPAAVKTSLAFGLIGEMEAREAQEKMISLMQQTQFVFKEVTREEYALMSAQQQRIHVTKEMSNAINALNSIEDNSAAIMPQIVSAMNEFAGAATLAGDSIEFMAAMSAMLIERGVTAQKAGTSLRMAYARLGANINGAADAVEAYGIQVKDSEGNMRGLETILNELAPVYAQLEQGQRMALAQAIAGNRHYARFVFLMEDLTRVNQLATEGYTQSKPVMDEAGNAIEYLADRMATQHHQLQVARAELDKWMGAMGEGFIPATTLATERQADFYREFVLTTHALTEAYPILGQVMGRIMAMQQIAEKMYAPFLSALLNIKQLQVALMTFHAIQRAVAGERIAYFDNEARGYGMATTGQYSLNRLVGIYNQGLFNTIQLKLDAIEVERAIAEVNQETHRTRWMALKAERDAIVDEIRLGSVRHKQAQDLLFMEQIRARLKKNEAHRNQLQADADKLTGQARLDALQKVYDKNSYIKSIKAEINELDGYNLRLLDKRMAKTDALYQKEVERMVMLTGTGSVVEQSGNALWLYDEAMDNANDTTGEMNWQLSGLQMGLMKASMGAMAATGVISLLGDVLFKGEDGARAARIQMISMALAGGIMMVQMGQAMTAMGGAAIQAGNLARANNAAAVSFNHLSGAAAAAAGSVGAAGTSMAATLGSVFKWTIGIVILSALLEKIGSFLGLWQKESQATGNFDYDWYNQWQTGQNSYFDTSPITDWTSALETAEDEMYSFGNAREELFFGFKAGSVSGALIKQIEQKGIENFVANTEVIQTNNFNGLTTDQVANVILDAIEEEGKARGMTF